MIYFKVSALYLHYFYNNPFLWQLQHSKGKECNLLVHLCYLRNFFLTKSGPWISCKQDHSSLQCVCTVQLYYVGRNKQNYNEYKYQLRLTIWRVLKEHKEKIARFTKPFSYRGSGSGPPWLHGPLGPRPLRKQNPTTLLRSFGFFDQTGGKKKPFLKPLETNWSCGFTFVFLILAKRSGNYHKVWIPLFFLSSVSLLIWLYTKKA